MFSAAPVKEVTRSHERVQRQHPARLGCVSQQTRLRPDQTPLAVRLNESTRTQLDIIAQLNDRTVTDEVRLAIEAWIDKTKADPAIQRRAKDVRDEIEREAAGKRDAIAAIFSSRPEPKAPRTPPKPQATCRLHLNGRSARATYTRTLARRPPCLTLAPPDERCSFVPCDSTRTIPVPGRTHEGGTPSPSI